MGSISVFFKHLKSHQYIKLSNATEKITFLSLEGHKVSLEKRWWSALDSLKKDTNFSWNSAVYKRHMTKSTRSHFTTHHIMTTTTNTHLHTCFNTKTHCCPLPSTNNSYQVSSTLYTTPSWKIAFMLTQCSHLQKINSSFSYLCEIVNCRIDKFNGEENSLDNIAQ